MNTRDVLLQAILADPADDLPRLAYADVCEEEGDPDRAAFIRESIAIANTGWTRCENVPIAAMPKRCGQCQWCQHARVIDLLHTPVCNSAIGKQPFDYVCTWGYGFSRPRQKSNPEAVLYFSRGWLREIAMSEKLFLGHGKELFCSHPIELVRLTDRLGIVEDWSRYERYCWLSPAREARANVNWQAAIIHERRIFDLLEGSAILSGWARLYSTLHAADTDLSQACVRYGIEQRGKA